MNRLTYDDDLFLRMECVLDVPVVNQIVWRFDDAVSEQSLDAMWRHLDAGPINRTVSRVRTPGARDRWVRCTRSFPLHVSDELLPAGEIGTWMQDRAAVAVDPITGPVWQLATARVEGGGSVVSLVASHVVGDGGALTSAAIAALRGPDEPEDFRTAWDRDEPHDLRDALGQIGTAAAGSARAIGRAVSSSLSRSAPGRSAPELDTMNSTPPPAMKQTVRGPFVPSTVVVDFDTAHWAAVARSVGGSANSLLVALALGILTASGRVDESETIKVSLPVSTRVPGDTRANATSGVSIRVAGGGSFRSDLGPIRRDSKSAFTTLADTEHATSFELTKPLMQMLPDAIVEKAAASATAPLCLCSNLGDRGAQLRQIDQLSARSVAMRSITQKTTAELLRRTRGGVSVWWNTSGERSTLCVTGLDPDCFPTSEHLRGLIESESRRWELTPNFW
ncbi:hypothetical protein [Rhodococcoides yunnanense]|uniref:hypothetical protein n=1 Tax=Rhodococcoides yunnanense TaxID=278209 RepID=UPI0009337BD2|nr:hypothetical protein [Rhodococcus yunnanensis]